MKRILRNSISSVLVLCMMASMLSAFATTAQPGGTRSSAYLDSYMAATTVESNGSVTVFVSVDAVVNATKIGARDIYLYESTNGVDFTCVKHFNYLSYPYMMGSGWHYSRDAVTYNGTAGRYYLANVYVYAANSTGSDSRLYSTAIAH
ncbi:MAG: hypothetical protein E7474_08290 [Ruminococcaceae bacterium]|nr:hypothetical protein [Oscillospiraceae bacterium]